GSGDRVTPRRAVAHHDDALELDGLRLQLEVCRGRLTGRDGHRLLARAVADRPGAQGDRPDGDAVEGEASGRVRDGYEARPDDRHLRARERGGGRTILHNAGDFSHVL